VAMASSSGWAWKVTSVCGTGEILAHAQPCRDSQWSPA
jgi:hypothetical protein